MSELDLLRMRKERFSKLQKAMADADIGALLLLTTGNVMYSAGAWTVPAEPGRTYQLRTMVLVVAGEPAPHVFTPYPEEAPPDLPIAYLHKPLIAESGLGVAEMVGRIRDVLGGRDVGRMGIDDYSFPMWTGLTKWLGRVQLVDAGSLMETVRLIKTPDELECMRRSWRITEEATRAVEKALQPGARLNELTGLFLQRTFELGADQNFLDPIFQAMPERIADGPWSTNGDVPFALVTNDHIIRQGDVVWTDTVAGYEGYASDVGRSWFVGKPNRRQHDLFKRWKEITDTVIGSIRPGTTGADLARIATEVNGGVRPWLDHYFLGHTLGLEGGESQRVGSDLGEESNNNFTLAPGMALVVEPVTWEDGYSGYRCEELLIVTESGCEKVSQYPNEPFE